MTFPMEKMKNFLLLVTLIVNLGDCRSMVVEECEAGDVCVRFCCKNETACLSFDLHALERAKNISGDYRIVMGQPCENMYIEEPWEFSAVSIGFKIEIEDEIVEVGMVVGIFSSHLLRKT